jgi:hypothetical protein
VKTDYWIPEIIQIILENTSRNKDGVTKTQLMYRTSLSHIQLVIYKRYEQVESDTHPNIIFVKLSSIFKVKGGS